MFSWSRRNTELGLLFLAAIPVFILFVLLEAGQSSGALVSFSPDQLIAPAMILALFLLTHLSLRFLAPNADPAMLPAVFALSSIGLAFVARLIPERVFTQFIWLGISLLALVAVLYFVPSLERLGNYKYLLMLAGLVLVLSPILIGKEINGSKLWIVFGGFSIQPGEIGRVFIILFLAAYLAENREMLSISTRKFLGMPLPELRVLGPLIIMWAISFVIMVAEKDLGSSLLFFAIFLVMIYVATGRFSYVFIGLALFGLGGWAAYKNFTHVQTRVSIWLEPFSDPAGKAYQLVQSQFAFADGGLLGTGIGKGMPTRIPFVDTDFIFAAIGEELGLLGAAAVLLLFLALIYRIVSVAARAKSDMASFTAVGFAASFGVQVFVIVGGVTGLIPLTGITVPFISRGGSSLLASCLILALLLRAGDETTGVASELNVSNTASNSLGRRVLTSRLTSLTVLVGIVFASLIAQLTWLQVIHADELKNNAHNTRGLVRERYVARGSILTRDEVTLAVSRPREDGTYMRFYPNGSMASHLLGYYSDKRGRSGIEAAANSALAGERRISTFEDALNKAVGTPSHGDNVVLTIDSRIQQAAEAALSGQSGKGSVVVLDPRNGAVLAAASSPNYNPELIDTEWDALNANEDAPLLDRSRNSLSAPGSTFKIVTLAAAYERGIATPDKVYPAPGRLKIGNADVTNFAGTNYGSADVRTATVKSINTVFAQLADEMGPEALVESSADFGFGETIPFELGINRSLMPEPSEMTVWETAWAGVGQPVGEHESPPGPQTNTFQMALVASAIANEGKIMRPHLIYNIRPVFENAVPYAGTTPRVWKTACSPEVAAQVKEAMVETVRVGSARGSLIKGVNVAAKTGTAEVGKNAPANAWFIAFAPAENPTVALAIMLEGAGQGGRAAAPAAQPILVKALEVQESYEPRSLEAVD